MKKLLIVVLTILCLVGVGCKSVYAMQKEGEAEPTIKEVQDLIDHAQASIDKNEADKKDVQTQITDIDKKVAELKTSLALIQSQVDAQKAKYEAAKAARDEVKAKYDKAVEDFTPIEKHYNELKEASEAATKKVQEIEGKIAELSKDVATLKAEQAKYNQQISDLKNAIDKLDAEIAALKDSIALLEAEVPKKQAALNVKEEELLAANAKCLEAEEKVANKQAEKDKKEAEVAELQAKYEQLEKEVKIEEAIVVSEKLQEAQYRLTQINSALTKLKEDAEVAKKDLANADEAKQNAEKELEEAKANCDKAQNNYVSKCKEKEANVKQLSELQDILNKISASIVDKEGKVEQFNDLLPSAKQDAEDKANELKNYAPTYNAAKDLVDKTKKDLDIVEDAFKKQETIYNDLTNKLELVKRSIEVLDVYQRELLVKNIAAIDNYIAYLKTQLELYAVMMKRVEAGQSVRADFANEWKEIKAQELNIESAYKKMMRDDDVFKYQGEINSQPIKANVVKSLSNILKITYTKEETRGSIVIYKATLKSYASDITTLKAEVAAARTTALNDFSAYNGEVSKANTLTVGLKNNMLGIVPSPSSNESSKKDESCEAVFGATWHWNNTKGVCEEYAMVGTATR